MSVYNHRAMVPATSTTTTATPQPHRILEMLETIRSDFDQLTQEAYICKSQRDEYENKSKPPFFTLQSKCLLLN
jgi:glucose repression regulatory protein TUP1